MAHPFEKVGVAVNYVVAFGAAIIVQNPIEAEMLNLRIKIFLLDLQLHALECRRLELEEHAETTLAQAHRFLDRFGGVNSLGDMFEAVDRHMRMVLEIENINGKIQDLRRQIADAQTMISACDRCEDRCICGYTMSWCPWVSGVSIPWPQYKANRCSSSRCDGRGGVVAEANVKVTSSS